MISKLPRWVLTGTFTLAFVAGSVNVVGIVGFQHQAVTHLTGNTSSLGAAIANGDISSAAHFLAVIGAFVAGASLSGFIIQDSTLRLRRRYGFVLLLVSLLLFASAHLLQVRSSFGLYLAACASGLQNAMVTTYSGSVVRTTHVSGMFTDLGIFVGHALRGIPIETRRLRLSIVVITGFLLGGMAGAVAFQMFAYAALFMPAVVTCVIALVSVVYGQRHRSSELRT